MRPIVTTCIVLFLCALLVTHKAGATDINQSDYQVISSLSNAKTSDCYGEEQTKIINNNQKPVCFYENNDVQVGIHHNNNYVGEVAVNFGPGSTLYPVKMNGMPFKCQFFKCIYMADSDTLLTQERFYNDYTITPVLYKNFTKNLVFRNSIINPYYDYINPIREPMGETSTSQAHRIDAYAFNISNNGRWLITEIKDVGIVRFDLKNSTHKRVYPDFLEHSTYPVSSSELAIDDSGTSIIHVGLNAGINIYKVNESCGDEHLDSTPIDNPCLYDYLGLNSVDSHSMYATNPRALGKDVLEFITVPLNYTGDYKRIRIAKNNSQVSSLKLLSLGDSYSSGQGETDDNYYQIGTNTKHEKCHTSIRSYPYLVANNLNLPSSGVKNVACSGAVTEDILAFNEENYMGQNNRLKNLVQEGHSIVSLKNESRNTYLPGRIKQNFFTDKSKPGVITVGIGGNDSGLMSKLNDCVALSTCKWAEDSTYKQAVGKEIKSLFSKLTKTYKDIKNNSPMSDIYAVGYPQLFSKQAHCNRLEGVMFNEKERIFVKESISYLNSVIQDAATNSGVTYLDIEEVFSGHALCDSTKTPAMNSIRLGDDVEVLGLGQHIGSEVFHPTPFGHRLIADAISGRIKQGPVEVDDERIEGAVVVSDIPEYWNEQPADRFEVKHKSINIPKNQDDSATLQDYAILPNSTSVMKIINLENVENIKEVSLPVNDGSALTISGDIFNLENIAEGVTNIEILTTDRKNKSLIMYDTITKSSNIQNEEVQDEELKNEDIQNDSNKNQEIIEVSQDKNSESQQIIHKTALTKLPSLFTTSFVSAVLNKSSIKKTENIEAAALTEPTRTSKSIAVKTKTKPELEGTLKKSSVKAPLSSNLGVLGKFVLFSAALSIGIQIILRRGFR